MGEGSAPLARGFLRWTGPMGRRVRKFDGPSGRGLWIALTGNAYKVSVTGFAFLSPVPHDEEPDPPSTGKQKPCNTSELG